MQVSEVITLEIDGQMVMVERLEDGTFRKPDYLAGAEREVIGEKIGPDGVPYSKRKVNGMGQFATGSYGLTEGRTTDGRDAKKIADRQTREHVSELTAPATDAAKQWDGWGTALKPAWEPVILARKPLSEANIAANVLRWGTGGLNVDGCRIGTDESLARPYGGGNQVYGKYSMERGTVTGDGLRGRWPANLALDEDAAALLDAQSGEQKSGDPRKSDGTRSQRVGNDGWDRPWKHGEQRQENFPGYGDSGGASRYFYCAKASRRDRDEGLEGMPLKDASVGDRRPSGSMSQRIHADEGRPDTKARNHHPTVKPTDLMRWLVRLITPPNGTVLDPFMGSGSTGKAAMLEGFSFVGIDIEQEYLDIADKRIAHAIATYVQQQEMAALQPQLWETTP